MSRITTVPHSSIYHNSEQPWLWFRVIKALFFKQVTLNSNWKPYWSSRTLSVVACSNTYINLQSLICCPGRASQNTQLMLQHMNSFTYVQPMEVYHPILSSSLHINRVPENCPLITVKENKSSTIGLPGSITKHIKK